MEMVNLIKCRSNNMLRKLKMDRVTYGILSYAVQVNEVIYTFWTDLIDKLIR